MVQNQRVTRGQKGKFHEVIDTELAELIKLGLTKDGLQAVFQSKDWGGVVEILRGSVRRVGELAGISSEGATNSEAEVSAPANPYASERNTPDSGWNYDTGTLPPFEKQVADIHHALGLSGVLAAKVKIYPDDGRADGVIAIPFLRDLGKALSVPDPTGTGYGRLGELVFEKVKAARNGAAYNYRNGELGSNYVRLNAEARAQLEALEARVPFEEGVVYYHVISVNTGSLFAGFSPRNARVTALEQGILPLGFVHVLCITLGWPERLSKYGVRWIDCPADEYNWGADGAWALCLCVDFDGDRLGLYADGAGLASSLFGSAVAFSGVPRDL